MGFCNSTQRINKRKPPPFRGGFFGRLAQFRNWASLMNALHCCRWASVTALSEYQMRMVSSMLVRTSRKAGNCHVYIARMYGASSNT